MFSIVFSTLLLAWCYFTYLAILDYFNHAKMPNGNLVKTKNTVFQDNKPVYVSFECIKVDGDGYAYITKNATYNPNSDFVKVTKTKDKISIEVRRQSKWKKDKSLDVDNCIPVNTIKVI